MKSFIPVFLVLAASAIHAEIPASDYTRAIFSDDFSGEGFGKRWGHYKSSSVVKDGVLHGITAETSDHPAVDNIVIPGERDLEVSVKFQYTSDKAQGFNIWFDDKNYKGSHAGHICSVVVNPGSVNMSDAKTGRFMNEIYEKSKATPPTLTAEDKKLLTTKSKNVKVELARKEWHTLVVRTKGDEVDTIIDGKDVGSFKSEGISHDTKTLVSITTNRVDVIYDDFSIKGVAK